MMKWGINRNTILFEWYAIFLHIIYDMCSLQYALKKHPVICGILRVDNSIYNTGLGKNPLRLPRFLGESNPMDGRRSEDQLQEVATCYDPTAVRSFFLIINPEKIRPELTPMRRAEKKS